MDRPTVEVYERGAGAYARQRSADEPERAEAFADGVEDGAPRLDLGCGPGFYLPLLGHPVVAVDAARAMVREAAQRAPHALVVQADLVDLPFRRSALGGVWASKAHQHLPAAVLPGALGELHRVLPVGGRLDVTVFAGPDGADPGTGISGPDDDFPGRLFTWWAPDALAGLLVGAGFEVESVEVGRDRARRLAVTATRARTLADTVGAGMRMLVCGLNPSLYAADAGVAFARPGNRFWPAMQAAGLARVPRDPRSLLAEHRIGLTDLVKRATPAAAELTAQEYAEGLDRVERLCRLLEPAAVCFVGLAGWRSAVERRAAPGWQERRLGPAPVYLMPSTSGLNAHSQVPALAEHLRAAAGAA